MRWIIAVLILGLLVFIHELGHFLFAKLNGVDVVEFSLGFGPRLVSTVFKGTRYSLKALPFGGSCQMKGMYADEEEEDSGDSGEGSFLNASLGRRAAIVIAGPLFNFLLAFVAAVIIISIVGYDPAVVLDVKEGSAAAEAGLKEDDLITSFMGRRVTISRDVSAELSFRELPENEPLEITVKRDGETVGIVYTPDQKEAYRLGLTYQPDDNQAEILEVAEGSPLDEAGIRANDVITALDGNGIGTAAELNSYLDSHPLSGEPVVVTIDRNGRIFEASVTPAVVRYRELGFDYNVGRVRTGPVRTLAMSLYEVGYWIRTTVRSLGMLFTGMLTVNDLSGPVGIVDIVGETYEESREEGPLMTWMNLLNIIIFLSANLGVMNLLPIPAVDGGRLLFILIEAIRGKPLDRRFESAVQMVAVALLLALMVYVMYHDLTRLFQ